LLESYSPYLKIRHENEEVMRAMRGYQGDALDQEDPTLSGTPELLREKLVDG
jgi:hypothetical protein